MRTWTARATPAGADGYRAYFEDTLLQSLRKLTGFRGAYLTHRELGTDTVEVATFTLWDSLEAVEAFAGADPTKAVVEPEAKAMLIDGDSHVTNRPVIASS